MSERDEELLRFVERFALLLHETGLPRMPARVFAFVLAGESESYTAGELAAGLRVSPAAISGAVRYLVQVGLLTRERAPGARTDHYRVYGDDVWSAILGQQVPLLERSIDFLTDNAQLLDADTPGGRRVLETLEFYRFMRADVPRMIERWRKHRADNAPSDRPSGRDEPRAGRGRDGSA